MNKRQKIKILEEIEELEEFPKGQTLIISEEPDGSYMMGFIRISEKIYQ